MGTVDDTVGNENPTSRCPICPILKPQSVLNMSRVFFGGNGPIHWRTTCAQAYAGVIFCGRVPTRAYAGGLLSRNAFANALVFNLLETRIATSSWPHLPLHWHIFPFTGASSPSSSPSLAHLPLHWHIFPFRQVGGGRGLGMVCFRESFREAFAGIREGP